MAGIPQFISAGAPGSAATFGTQAEQAGASWMNAGANAQRAASESKLQGAQTQQLQTMMPALVAKAQADQATDLAKVQQAQIVQNSRTRAAAAAPAATDEFLGIMGNGSDPANNMANDENGNPDYGAQYNALAGWQAKNSYMSMLPEYHDLWGQVEQAKQNAFNMNAKNNAAEIHMQQQQMVQDALTQRATFQGGVRQNVAQTAAGATVAAAGERAGGTEGAAQIRTGGEQATAAQTALEKNADFYERQATALQATDPIAAKAAWAKASAIHDQLGQAPASAATPAPGVEPTVEGTPAATGNLPPNTKTITIGGQNYPVMFNKRTGQRGYRSANGTIIPLTEAAPQISFTPPPDVAVPAEQPAGAAQ